MKLHPDHPADFYAVLILFLVFLYGRRDGESADRRPAGGAAAVLYRALDGQNRYFAS